MTPRSQLRILCLLAGAALCAAAPARAQDDAGEIVSSLQQPTPLPTPGGYGLLVAPTLIGRYGLTAKDVLLALAPQLANATIRAKTTGLGAGGDVVHEEYELWLGPWKLDDAYISLHHHKNRLAFLRAKLPDYRLPADPPAEDDFLPLAGLGFELPEAARAAATRVIASSSGFPVPAWSTRAFDPRRGLSVERIIDAQTGAVLRETELSFDAATAQVYERNPRESQLSPVELPGLATSGFLDGNHFHVFAPGDGDTRAQSAELKFEYRPDEDGLNFDQASAYYTAEKALAFFKDKFGYDLGDAQLKVRVGGLVGGRAENAAYVPPPEGPELQIGKGGEHLSGLARDTDVIVHEFSHHVIFAHVTTSAGESGIFHEGTADYFAYAASGDPNLAESVTVGPFLRTAALDPGLRFDSAPAGQDNHYKGQFWSAVLWELRLKLGTESFDKTVYQSLAYMGPRSGFKDAFNALLNADRDLNPLPDGDPEKGVFGANKCAIIAAGVARGFAVALEGHDAFACGLDLPALATASRALTKSVNDDGKEGKMSNVTVFGKRCSSVGDGGDAEDGFFALIWLLALPVLVSALSPFLGSSGAAPRRRDDGP